VTGSGNGIYFNSSGNFYANNRARGNTTNYNTGGHAQTDGRRQCGFLAVENLSLLTGKPAKQHQQTIEGRIRDGPALVIQHSER